MKIVDLLFGKPDYLLSLTDYEAKYVLDVVNVFKFGKENEPIQLETNSELILEQKVVGNHLQNTISLLAIEGNTENDNMKPHLAESLLLADITRDIHVKRNTKGAILSILHKERMWQDWERWKSSKLAEIYPEQKKQIKFAHTYEEGLRKFEDAFKVNLQYIFLLPELYHVTFPPHRDYSYLTTRNSYPSRLIEGLVYDYQFKLVKLEQSEEAIDIILHAAINNSSSIIEQVKPYYEKSDFPITDFSFSIAINYTLEIRTSKILLGELILLEKMHDDFYYQIAMNLKERE